MLYTQNISLQKTLPVIFFLVSAILFIVPGTGGAQSSGDITILDGGNIWIEGTAGPVDFTCRAEELSGRGKITTPQDPVSSVTKEGGINISIGLPTESLNCGKRAMNRDMYNALRAEEFPSILYNLLEASLADDMTESENEEWMRIRTKGIMEIAGVQDTTTVTVLGKVLEDNKFRAKGMKEIHMDTYNIDPPSKMFGLVRASKDLLVHFDVTVALNDTVASLDR